MSKLIDIQAQIEALRKEAEVIRSKDMGETIADIRAKMAAFGITVKDLQAAPKKAGRKAKAGATLKAPKAAKAAKTTTKVEAKYKGPNGETWSGRGIAPKWLTALVQQGRTREEFLIAVAAAAVPAAE